MITKKIRLYHMYKQQLLKKASQEQYLHLIESFIGLHSTDYLTPYISLWARIDDFDPERLFKDLNVDRNVLRMRAMRSTLFIVHKNNIQTVLSAIEKIRNDRFKEGQKLFKNEIDIESTLSELVKILHATPHLKTTEMKKKLVGTFKPEEYSFIKNCAELNGRIVRTKQKNILDKLYRFGLLEDWIPEASNKIVPFDEAITNLFEKYILTFGPASLDDFSWWLPETKTKLNDIIDASRENYEVINFENDEYFLHKNDSQLFHEFDHYKYSDDIINFLPYEDHFPKAYIKREYFISEEASSQLFTGTYQVRSFGEIRPSIWLNGEAIGRWEYDWVDKKKSAFKVSILYLDNSRIGSKSINKLIEEKRTELEYWLNEKIVPLIK